MSNYATKADLKYTTGIDTSKFAKKVDLTNLKSNVDKLDMIKLTGCDSSFNSWIVKKDSINEQIFSRSEIFRKKSEN